ncbi:hypothetical protein ACHHYP_08929 [Achlya hypogyna]|uniref:Macro domain-containing protein n=1 Tax=Achlya hypogyna TaxID=1202772 RepID=A0A1V9ZJU6_ACHHY|nr:hypothetical protein ACHHYP_08929 [Achlya hypogyna]
MTTRTYLLSPTCAVAVSVGDITRWAGDAVVNAANERMLGGSGVDGAIHKAAGPQLYEACEQVPQVRRSVRCPVGEARITPAFRLPATHVIHTVGPVYRPNSNAPALLRSAYLSALALAHEHHCATVAFPAISCGVYHYPLSAAATIALEACVEFTAANPNRLQLIEFVMFTTQTHAAWTAAAAELHLTEIH